MNVLDLSKVVNRLAENLVSPRVDSPAEMIATLGQELGLNLVASDISLFFNFIW